MNDNDEIPKTNIFGVVVNTDREMELKAPNLDISDENEIEEAGFNPFSNNLFANKENESNLRVGDEKEPPQVQMQSNTEELNEVQTTSNEKDKSENQTDVEVFDIKEIEKN